MSNGWLAQVGADPRARAREIARAYAVFASTRSIRGASGLRDVVAQSWLRSRDANVDPDTDPPVTLTGQGLAAYRAAHPLSPVVPVLRDLVGGIADDTRHLWAVSDAGGRLLWVEGHRGIRAHAARMNFVEGAQWDEAHAGTNAPGTALALDHEVQIFATEHFGRRVQAWTCAAAPIHDPVSGQILGVVDVTGGDLVAHPHSLALVRAAARAAETELSWQGRRREPRPEPPPRAARLEALGRPEGLLRLDGVEHRLNRRHTELLLLLTANPHGMTGEQLAGAVYGDHTNQTTMRVELTRLRRVVGDLVQSRPYRLSRPVTADYLDVQAALHRGDTAEAVRAYSGPLLPTSEAPGVLERRRWMETRLRSAVLACGDTAVLQTWTERFGFDDLELWERLAALLPETSPCRAAAASRVGRLRADYGLGGDATFG